MDTTLPRTSAGRALTPRHRRWLLVSAALLLTACPERPTAIGLGDLPADDVGDAAAFDGGADAGSEPDVFDAASDPVPDEDTVFMWFDATDGDEVDADVASEDEPDAEPPAIAGNMAITSGFRHTCVLASDGAVLCWGANDRDQLADSTVESRPAAARVSLPSAATQVAAGVAHTCALLDTSEVWCWGRGSEGQLGSGDYEDSDGAPSRVEELGAATAIGAGGYNTCAIVAAQVYCWGRNSERQVTLGVGGPYVYPVLREDVGEAVAVQPTDYGVCAIHADETATCWGRHQFTGDDWEEVVIEEGDGTLTFVANRRPLELPLRHVQQIAGSASLNCARVGSEALPCWADIWFELDERTGNVHRVNAVSANPFSVSLPSAPVDVAVSPLSDGNAACALGAEGDLWCWGFNYSGVLGRVAGSRADYYPEPSRMEYVSPATAISMGADFACALIEGGEVECWGENGLGQLGRWDSTATHLPGLVVGLP